MSTYRDLIKAVKAVKNGKASNPRDAYVFFCDGSWLVDIGEVTVEFFQGKTLFVAPKGSFESRILRLSSYRLRKALAKKGIYGPKGGK